MRIQFAEERDWLDLEDLTLDDKGNFLDSKGKLINVEEVGSKDFIVFRDGRSFPEYKDAPEGAEAYLLGKTKEIPEEAVELIPGTGAKIRTYRTEIRFYRKIK